MLLRADGRVAYSNALPLRGDFSQSEIENFCLTSIRHEDIGGLNVPMDDTLSVCRIQRICDLDSQIEHRLDLQRFSSDLVFEGLAFKVLHGDERIALMF